MKFSIYQESRKGARKIQPGPHRLLLQRDALLMVIADGMGGHLHGEVASQIAMQLLTEAFQREARPKLADPAAVPAARPSPTRTTRIVDYAARAQPARDRRAPPASPAWCRTRIAYWAHVGRFAPLPHPRRAAIEAQTKDHSRVQMLVDQGRIREEAVAAHPERNKIFNCLGRERAAAGRPVASRRRCARATPCCCAPTACGARSTAALITAALLKNDIMKAMPELLDLAELRAGRGLRQSVGGGDDLGGAIARRGRRRSRRDPGARRRSAPSSRISAAPTRQRPHRRGNRARDPGNPRRDPQTHADKAHDDRPSERTQPTNCAPCASSAHYTRHAEGSVLVEFGDTRVICTASVEEKVPGFLKGRGQGWVTAEYGMLPRATNTRTDREAARGKQSGRTQEIQRLIGRSLRAVTDLSKLGERTIQIDCDVHPGRRRHAHREHHRRLRRAARRGGTLLARGLIAASPIRDFVAAVSVGIYQGVPVLDLDYAEDSSCDTDMNVVMTGSGGFVEVQGTAEGAPFSPAQMDALLALAQKGIGELIAKQKQALGIG